MSSGERSTTLLDLLKAGIIEPKKSALSVSYKSIETVADLLPDGTISLKQVPLLQACGLKPEAKQTHRVGQQFPFSLTTLRLDGQVLLQGRRGNRREKFKSLSAFALHVIRRSFPERRAVDGWQAVKYKGNSLEALRAVFLGVKPHSGGHLQAPRGEEQLPLYVSSLRPFMIGTKQMRDTLWPTNYVLLRQSRMMNSQRSWTE